MNTHTEIGVGVVVLIIIFAVWYYMTHKSVKCTDSTGCTVGANLACIGGKCGPVACSTGQDCATNKTNTTCDVTALPTKSATFGTCIAPSTATCDNTSTDCNVQPFNTCNGKICVQAMCTAANESTMCTGATTQCDVTLSPIKSPTYGQCIPPSSVRQRK